MKWLSDKKVVLLVVTITIFALGCNDQQYVSVRPLGTSTSLWGPALFLRTRQQDDGLLIVGVDSNELSKMGRQTKEFLHEVTKRRPPLLYRDKPQQLVILDAQSWGSESGAVLDCTGQLDAFHGKPLRYDGGEKVLLFNENKMETEGRSVLRAYLSPDKKHVAALSAEGEYQLGMMFGGEGASGKRFHQVFRTADGLQVGETMLLADAPKKGDDVNQCWSPDGRWVVYDDAKFEKVWIVPGVPASKENKP